MKQIQCDMDVLKSFIQKCLYFQHKADFLTLSSALIR